MSGTIHDQLLPIVSGRVLLKDSVKNVLSSSKMMSRSFGEDIPLSVFMVWVDRDSQFLLD